MPGYLLLALLSVPVGRAYIWLFYRTRDRLFGACAPALRRR